MLSTWPPWRSCGGRFMRSRATLPFASSFLPGRARRRLLPGRTLASWLSKMRLRAGAHLVRHVPRRLAHGKGKFALQALDQLAFGTRAIPVSLIGAVFLMLIAGFTI